MLYSRAVRVLQYGMGPIGQSCARLLLDRERTGHVRLVGAVDISPALIGRGLDSLLGRKSDVVITSDVADTLAKAQPEVVLHTTSSFLDRVKDQILHCVQSGAHVISSTEELAFPYHRHPEISVELDTAAKKKGVVVLGTGVNPGYAMDALVLAATGVSTGVRRIIVDRIVDAGKRRESLQRKIAAGVNKEEFMARCARGGLGHIGLRESLEMVAAGLGWPLDGIEETLEPVLAQASLQTPYLIVKKGHVAGIHQVAIGRIQGQERIRLTLKMYVGAPDSIDRIRVHGTPPIEMVVAGGIFGDSATVGSLVNAIPRVMAAVPGLHTGTSLPLPRACCGRDDTPSPACGTPS